MCCMHVVDLRKIIKYGKKMSKEMEKSLSMADSSYFPKKTDIGTRSTTSIQYILNPKVRSTCLNVIQNLSFMYLL